MKTHAQRCGLGRRDAVEQILALGVQEVVALLGLFVLFEGGRIHGAEIFDALAQQLVLLFGLGQGDFVEETLEGPAISRMPG